MDPTLPNPIALPLRVASVRVLLPVRSCATPRVLVTQNFPEGRSSVVPGSFHQACLCLTCFDILVCGQ